MLKPDLSWRLCVDPNALNRATVPMTWEIPRVRELLQTQLRGAQWFCKFDFISMFWQIPLDEESRKLFCFYAGELGTFCFNRCAMGALNSSVYTQRMVTGMFTNVNLPDGRPLLGNALLVLTDDVLLYAVDQIQMIVVLDLFLTAVTQHRMAIYPGKCEIFRTETTYCGHLVTRRGITVEPERLHGLKAVSPPETVGHVWQFNAATGWIRTGLVLLMPRRTTVCLVVSILSPR